MTTTEVLTQEQQVTERLRSLATVYQTTDRILCSGEGVQVRVESWAAVPAAAWTDGSKITINSAKITDTDTHNVERMHGVNFHEIAHVLFTPRVGTSLVSWVIANGFNQEFNILEDQRIETLLVTQYPSTAPWFTAAIARWVLEGDCSKTGYTMVRGRRYLPGTLRGALRSTFFRQDALPELDRIIDEYIHLVFPADYDRAQQLIEDFARLLNDIRQSPNADGIRFSDPNNHNERPVDVVSNGRPSGVSQQRKLRDRIADGEPEVVPQTPKPSDSESTDSDSSDDLSAGDSDDFDDDFDFGDDFDDDADFDGGVPTDQFDGGSNTASPSPNTNTPPPASTSTPSPTPGAGDGPGSLENVLNDIAKEVLSDVRSQSEVRDEIRATQRKISNVGGSDVINRGNWEYQSPLPQYVALVKSLRRSLDRLLRKADPGWETHQPAGRINVDRWVRDNDVVTAFDSWDEGVHDVVDMECVIMLDESGSMGNTIKEATNAMWVLKRSLDRIGASTTVITFDTESRVLYHRKDKATTDVRYSFHSGGTDPVNGLSQAARIFARTDKSQKIFVILTDGEWNSRKDDEGVSSGEYLRRFNANGVTTALGFIADEDAASPYLLERLSEKGCKITGVVNGAALVSFVSDIVTDALSKRLAHR